jgi:signal transduction histidine kinase/CheY-like chemotaxis protein
VGKGLTLLVVALVEFGLVVAGLRLATVHGSVSPIWPASGFAVANLVLAGRWLWPAVLVGSFLGNVASGAPWTFCAGAAVANTMEAVVAATLLRDVGFRPALDRARDVLLFVLHACVAGAALGALIGVTSLTMTGMMRGVTTWEAFLIWWVGDAMGLLLVAPLILVWSRRPRLLGRSAIRVAEGLVLTLLVVVTSAVVFGGRFLEQHDAFPLAFALFPLFIWAALRFGPRGMITQLSCMSAIAVAGAARGAGPMASVDVELRTDLLWSLIGVASVTGMVMAAIVSERRRAEAVLRQREAELRQSQKLEAIGTLAGGIAHDFNNILGAVVGYTELALPDVAAGTRAQSNLHEVLRAAQRGRNLVDQALLFSGRRGDDRRERIGLHEVVDEAVRLLRPSLPRAVSVRTRIDSRADDVLGSRVQLDQVVLNLCTNAAQAMPDGGRIGIDVDRVVLAASPAPGLPPGHYVRLVVSDTGTGIDAAVLPRVFDPFFSTKVNGSGAGHGLGLAVSHDIVAKHGGTLTVVSRPEGGATFTVLLPAAVDETSRPVVRDVAAAARRGRILFLDDEATLVELGRQMLETLGYEVRVFTVAEDATRAFRADPDAYTAVVTDQVMPRMTGDEVASELLRIRPDLPIVLCTGFGRALTPERARALGVREYLRKPFTLEDLAGALRRATMH